MCGIGHRSKFGNQFILKQERTSFENTGRYFMLMVPQFNIPVTVVVGVSVVLAVVDRVVSVGTSVMVVLGIKVVVVTAGVVDM